MNNQDIFFVSLAAFVLLSFLMAVGILLSKNEFSDRNNWKTTDRATGKIDWPKVDASKFALFFLGKCWLISLGFVCVFYFLLRWK